MNILTLDGWGNSLIAAGYQCKKIEDKIISTFEGSIGERKHLIELTIEEPSPGNFTASLKGLGEYLFNLGPTSAIEKFNSVVKRFFRLN